uniref:Sulfotransferase domain-containing protein n=1 Tax=Alexandrium catenella TaxID=2925 RepID=A0A7S1WSV5_ALECA
MPRFLKRQRGERWPLRQAPARSWKGPLWFFAASHKAGTNLLFSLASIQASTLGLAICSGTCGANLYFGKVCEIGESTVSERTMFYCNTGAADLEKARKIAGDQLRAVQIVRDPLAMVVSGYVYDMRQKVDGFHASRSMRRMSLAQGLATEAEFAVKNVLPQMLNVYRHGQTHGDSLVLRMEDFEASSEKFDETVARLFNYTMRGLPAFYNRGVLEMMLQSAAKEDIRRNPVPDGLSFVSPVMLKDEAHSALSSIPADLLKQLYEYRRELGYPADLPDP